MLEHVDLSGGWTYVEGEVEVLARASLARISTLLR
jgi:hypothetical protein